jgi:hypothetical protein
VRCARVCATRRTTPSDTPTDEDLLKLLFGQRPDANDSNNNSRSAELGMSSDDVFVASTAGWDSQPQQYGDVTFGAFVDVISDEGDNNASHAPSGYDVFEVEAASDIIGAEHADAYIDVVLNNLRQEDPDHLGLETLCRTLDGDDDHLNNDADDDG